VHSLGSGVIVSPDGHILTNNHVVAGADKLTVIPADKKKSNAKVVGTDPLTDVAAITGVVPGSPADDAALQRGDLIKEGNRVRVSTVREFGAAVRDVKNGDTMALLVRRGNENLYVTLKVG
jgi:S1-C subfamily serine protease